MTHMEKPSHDLTAHIVEIYNTNTQDLTGEHNYRECRLKGELGSVWVENAQTLNEGDKITGTLTTCPLNINGETKDRPVFAITNKEPLPETENWIFDF